MIRLRTTQGEIEGVARLLLDTVGQAAEETGLLRVDMYHSATYTTDLALSLMWDTDPVPGGGSRAGLAISEDLRSFGLVDHSVWVGRGMT